MTSHLSWRNGDGDGHYIQLHGGYGILEEYDVAHDWLDAKVLEICEGSKEVEKVIIAGKMLGKF